MTDRQRKNMANTLRYLAKRMNCYEARIFIDIWAHEDGRETTEYRLHIRDCRGKVKGSGPCETIEASSLFELWAKFGKWSNENLPTTEGETCE